MNSLSTGLTMDPPGIPESGDLPYPEVKDPVSFDPVRHLELTRPETIWTLDQFGYTAEEVAQCASNVGVTSPFRLLSREGVSALYSVADNLRSACTHIEGNRTPNHLAGGVYRSRFLRDLCTCPQIIDHMSEIAGTDLTPHSMPSQQVYVNYAPQDVTKAVDAWHYDGIGFDYVIMVSDPTVLKGGAFEYYLGTRKEIADLEGITVPEVRYGVTRDLPEDQVIRTQFPGAGYAIFQQGNMVVHRAARLLEPGDRITAVPGLVSRQSMAQDPTAKQDMTGYNEPGILGELARHSAWVAQGKLAGLVRELPLEEDPTMIVKALREAIKDVNEVAAYLEIEDDA